MTIPCMAWMVKHVGWLLTVRSRGRDGRTAYERLRGKPFSKRMVGFGETCLAKLTKHAVAKEGVPKIAPRWCRAVFLGYCRETHEYLFHTQGRILRSRALQRFLKAHWFEPKPYCWRKATNGFPMTRSATFATQDVRWTPL